MSEPSVIETLIPILKKCCEEEIRHYNAACDNDEYGEADIHEARKYAFAEVISYLEGDKIFLLESAGVWRKNQMKADEFPANETIDKIHRGPHS